MIKLLLVGIGGATGAVGRYLLSGFVTRFFGLSIFPYGTATVNIMGCLIIGIIVAVAERQASFNDYHRALLITGILGGFTTFSAFANETVELLRQGHFELSLVNVIVQITLCLAAVYLGRQIVTLISG